MVVTAHYINAHFKLKKKIISFKEVQYPHTGIAIEEALVSCLTEWGIRDKVFTLTVDNAGNNNRACEVFVQYHKRELMLEGAHFHVRCCAHILNILVQDGMNIIHGAIKKIRELLKHLDSSRSRIQAFNQIVVGIGLPAKRGIALDIPNRWNSTFKMVGEALKYKEVLNSYAYQYAECSPNEEEWLQAEAICEFLKALQEATNVVSADRTPTAQMFLPLVLSIRHALNDQAWQTGEVLKDLAAAMKIKFEKYWGADIDESNPFSLRKKDYYFNLAIAIATLLDPRREGEYVEFFYRKVCRNADSVNACLNSALEWMKKYFSEYERRVRRDVSYYMTCSPVASCSCIVGSPILGKRGLEEEFENFKSSQRRERAPKSEIDTYFEEEYVADSKGFDILVWWKTHSEKYPALSAMARDFLTIPLRTVSSESAFSLGGRILGEARSSLTPQMLEALVCGKDCLFMEKDAGIHNQVQYNTGPFFCIYL